MWVNTVSWVVSELSYPWSPCAALGWRTIKTSTSVASVSSCNLGCLLGVQVWYLILLSHIWYALLSIHSSIIDHTLDFAVSIVTWVPLCGHLLAITVVPRIAAPLSREAECRVGWLKQGAGGCFHLPQTTGLACSHCSGIYTQIEPSKIHVMVVSWYVLNFSPWG